MTEYQWCVRGKGFFNPFFTDRKEAIAHAKKLTGLGIKATTISVLLGSDEHCNIVTENQYYSANAIC